ncbi:MAG TPA: hypothetical protein VHU44_18875 [Acidobacteriaceae bacterium]|nr:hypothetical protein [Acidobacteriaceae bacterium]
MSVNISANLPASSTWLQHPVRMKVMTQRSLRVVVNSSVSSANYTIVAQSRNEVLVPENSPSVSMWPYLLNSAQTQRLNKISVYADRGTSSEQTRLLYMNAAALRTWREMGMPCTVVGESHRPPRSAMLSFGSHFPSDRQVGADSLGTNCGDSADLKSFICYCIPLEATCVRTRSM